MPHSGENFESVLLVSENFNEESARKAGGLSLVPKNISILIRVTESFVFSLEYCTCSTDRSHHCGNTKEGMIEVWIDKNRLTHISHCLADQNRNLC